MSLNNKTIANTFKDLLQLDQNGSGMPDAFIVTVKDGDGDSTALQLGKRGVIIHPTVNTVSTFEVEDIDGTNILTVSATDKIVKVNQTQTIANTQYLRFGAKDIDVNNGTHYAVPIAGMGPNTAINFGSSSEPSAPAFSNNGDDWIHYLHYVDKNITVDEVSILFGATAATGDTLNFHLLNLATSDSGTVDEWSTTTVVADDSGTTSAGYEQFYKVSLNLTSDVNIDAGNYLALTVEGNGTNSDYSINALVRYHIR
tara:strand:- start:4443 stop:5210 length:768 start_codon:yes stop_codon:yes gene_type:complete